ncbi:uncharacterized protein K460DRAFT_299988 [Cucurbitaria berberidis CBS 394.84]|uniref:Aminoglycoside phosphotransferase domain-containing protein n=1 Tax=Cucurbitaria berberidis CBS 394.84 TaxID=1168544 RepID=A0A9P4GSX7_9PLEO|nr:uncharacterized protein K460DRAFT_299988 [Cucurbitaria berberidis CBS 394.84]KAF1852168.1 hypothetical protein K460DRAFT_299988 [Cucurbitaria berberidis CBS 394.84]
MNPYEANPENIPPTDRYADVPLYGRYLPRPTDFTPDAKHMNCTTPESLGYWFTVLKKCTESNRIYDNQDGGRDVFALGSVIIKSSHLKANPQGRRSHRDYSYADANEVEALALARKVLDSTKVPQVYFAAKINERDVFVQKRIPGVGLNIAWQYISQSQKSSFKQQVREILQKLRTISPAEISRRSYVVPDPDPVEHRGIQELEREIIFAEDNKDPELSFMHNDVSLSNCIVDNDRIVGLIDWEMAGFFGWKTAANVHAQIRTPKRENFASLNLPEDMLNDMLFWNDLYDVE